MSDVRVAVVTAAGSGMGAAVAARWRPRVRVAVLSSSGGVKRSPTNSVVSGSPARISLPMTSDGSSRRPSTRWGRIDAVVNPVRVTVRERAHPRE